MQDNDTNSSLCQEEAARQDPFKVSVKGWYAQECKAHSIICFIILLWDCTKCSASLDHRHPVTMKEVPSVMNHSGDTRLEFKGYSLH